MKLTEIVTDCPIKEEDNQGHIDNCIDTLQVPTYKKYVTKTPLRTKTSPNPQERPKTPADCEEAREGQPKTSESHLATNYTS